MLVQLREAPRGGVARAHEVASDGRVVNRSTPLAVRLPKSCHGAATPGSVWLVDGEKTKRTWQRDGFTMEQEVVHASTARFQRPAGGLLARWIAANVDGIGEVIARRLVRAVADLDGCVRQGDIRTLTAVAGVSVGRARALVECWPHKGLYDVLAWLQEANLPLGLSDRLSRVYGESAVEVLSRDPFMLLGFGVSFDASLRVATGLGIKDEDDRLLIGLAEHVAARSVARTGSTVVSAEALLRQMRLAAGGVSREALERAPELACQAGALVRVPAGYQSLGHALMERRVADFLRSAAMRERGEGALLAGWEIGLSQDDVASALAQHERRLPFALTAQQRTVISRAVQCPVAIITGPAGSGKSTIVRGVLDVYGQVAVGLPIVQVALSGRAARRLVEATGRPAKTIAKCVSDHLGGGKPSLPEHLLLVVDEASMVDLISCYRLIGLLPAASRVLLIGDDAQLPPVGPGVVFHALLEGWLPVLRLSEVKRQRVGSAIARLAGSIRAGEAPELPGADEQLSPSCEVRHTRRTDPLTIAHLWEQAGGAGRAIILSPTRKASGGIDEINAHLQSRAGVDRPALHYHDDTRGWIPWEGREGRVLRLEDQIMVSANDYEADIRNGDLGSVTAVFDAPTPEGTLGLAQIDGRSVALTADVLAVLTLGYAVTIHKSQGSEWPVVIVVLPRHAAHMMVRPLLYTAVTRATEQLVICGDAELLEVAVTRDVTAMNRSSNLGTLLA